MRVSGLKFNLNLAPQVWGLEPVPDWEKTADWEKLFLCLLNFDLLGIIRCSYPWKYNGNRTLLVDSRL